jgi:hypothetical protein
MKNIFVLTFAALIFALSACEQKKDLSTKASEATQELTEKVQDAAQQTAKDVAAKAQEGAKKAGEEAVKVGKEVVVNVQDKAKNSAVIVKQTSDQFLADTIEHGREVTKTQNSAARQRGQNAEDEMMMDLGKGGK